MSRSGQVAFANVTMTKQPIKFSTCQAKQFVNTGRAGAGDGLQVAVEGQVAEQTAALLPLVTDGVALGAGTATAGLLSHVIHMASFSSQLSR